MEPGLVSSRECSCGNEGEETQAWPPTARPPTASLQSEGADTAPVSSQSEREANLCFQSTPSLRRKQPSLRGACS